MKQTFKQFMEAGRTFNVRTGEKVEPTKPAESIGKADDFKIGDIVKVKATGEEVEVLGHRGNLVATVTTDKSKLHDFSAVTARQEKLNLFSSQGHKEYLPRELEAK